MFKKRGYMDRLYFINFVTVWVFVCLCYFLTVFSGFCAISDLSIVSVGVPCAFTELGIHTGFIVWKAKTENISKYGGKNNITMDDSFFE